MSRCRIAALLVAMTLVAAACGSSGDESGVGAGSTTSAAAPPSSAAPVPSSDAPTTTAPVETTSTSVPESTTTVPCGSGGDLERPAQSRTMTTSVGESREFSVYLPTGYEHDGTRVPVVFNFHGRGSNAAEQYVYGNFIEQAERDGAILVNPQALPRDGAVAWRAGETGEGLDLDYIDELVDLIRSEYCVGDMLATGMSSGGAMTSAIACWDDSPFGAYGPVTLALYDPDTCGSVPPRPFVYFHGTIDDTVPYDGAGELDAAPVTAQEWADHNGCDPDPTEEDITDEVTHFSWTGCDAPTDFYRINGGNHTWPGAIAVESLGYVTDDISASDLIWELFLG